MQPCVLRRCGGRIAQHALTIAIPLELPVEIGKIDRPGHKLWAQPQRGPIFRFRLDGKAAPGGWLSVGAAARSEAACMRGKNGRPGVTICLDGNGLQRRSA
jgi:hypothetical protein